VVRQDLPGTTDSYRRWVVEGVGADIKEAICRVSDSAFNAEENANIPTVTYRRACALLLRQNEIAVPRPLMLGLPVRSCRTGRRSRSDGSEDVRVCSEGWNPSKRGDGAASDPQR